MKRSFFLMAFSFACLTGAQAATMQTIFTDDFTQYAAETDKGKVNTALSKHGWTTSTGSDFDITADGLTTTQNESGYWAQSKIYTDLGTDNKIQLGTSNSTYQFSFTLKGASANNQSLFCLAGNDFSLLLGNSYDSSKSIKLGSVAANALNSNTWYSFQNSSISTTINPDPASGTEVTIPASDHTWDYSVTLTTATDGTNTLSYTVNGTTVTYNFESKSELTQMGFLQDGGANGITLKNFTASKSIPEPTTATLG
ncbi:MAG: hypothetical protein RSA21_02050, partial [Akkermansia sp.]